MNTEKLNQILRNSIDNKKIFGADFAVKYKDEYWNGMAGNFSENQPYFIASTTKLFTTALIFQLIDKGLLRYDSPIGDFIDSQTLTNLHIYKGIDHSKNITVEQLLAHTSGLPDYFQGKNHEGESLENHLLEGLDRKWSADEAIILSKKLSPHFIPGTKGKAFYSDTNFQLLGKIIESITGESIDKNIQELIIKPLNLGDTYMYRDPNDNLPKALFFKSSLLRIPLAMSSFGPDGGMVSTSKDMVIFLEAFMKGKLFSIKHIDYIQKWNKMFFPMQSGVGIHLFKLPWYFNPTGAVPALIGHSGLSGALAFYSPKHDLFICGTVNQVAYNDQSFKTAIKLINTVLTRKTQ